MKNIDDEETFKTRASLKAATDDLDCDDCGLPLVFALETAAGERFSVDFPTILSCLRIAEKKGFAPQLGEDWWQPVAIRYNLWGEIYSTP